MKVIQINSVYGSGSTGKLVKDLRDGLERRGIEAGVCYGRGTGSGTEGPGIFRICSEPYAKMNHLAADVSGIMYGGCLYSTRRLLSILAREKPDIVHLQCINGYFVNIYKLLDWLKTNHVNTVLTLHAEFMYTGGCSHAYECRKWKEEAGCRHCPRWKAATGSLFTDRTDRMWAKMKSAFQDFDRHLVVCSVSPWLLKRAESSVILKDKDHRLVMNGIDTENTFYPHDAGRLRRRVRLENKKVILHVTPCFSLSPGHVKGGRFIVEMARRLRRHGDNAVILVAGPYEKPENCPDNLIFLGPVLDQDLLAEYYSLADVTLLTSRRETFSLVTAESLACGTPVVGFKAGGPESIALKEYSTFVDHGKTDALYQAVTGALQKSWNSDSIAHAASVYSKEHMADRYADIYRELAGNS